MDVGFLKMLFFVGITQYANRGGGGNPLETASSGPMKIIFHKAEKKRILLMTLSSQMTSRV